jgi:streptogramin lyase
LALVSATATVTGKEITQEARVEATIPQLSHDMATAFDSVWMMGLGTRKLIRINPSDNSVTEILIPGAVGPFTNAGLVAGEGALWLADHPRSIIYKIDPVTNRVAKEILADLLGSTGVAARA